MKKGAAGCRALTLVIIIEVEHMIRVDNMSDQQIVEAYAAYFARKAQEAYNDYQSVGMKKYDNAYHKCAAIAEALERDVQKADGRQAYGALKSKLLWLASSASNAMRKDAPEDALLKFAKEVIAAARLYGYDDNGEGEL